ncbi:hypothetical protein F899_01793 [Acinetobacter sp. CIP 101934]|nr:hypothetical protein F899_01793 [Acinetobacter sp. CIP 101934]
MDLAVAEEMLLLIYRGYKNDKRYHRNWRQ